MWYWSEVWSIGEAARPALAEDRNHGGTPFERTIRSPPDPRRPMPPLWARLWARSTMRLMDSPGPAGSRVA